MSAAWAESREERGRNREEKNSPAPSYRSPYRTPHRSLNLRSREERAERSIAGVLCPGRERARARRCCAAGRRGGAGGTLTSTYERRRSKTAAASISRSGPTRVRCAMRPKRKSALQNAFMSTTCGAGGAAGGAVSGFVPGGRAKRSPAGARVPVHSTFSTIVGKSCSQNSTSSSGFCSGGIQRVQRRCSRPQFCHDACARYRSRRLRCDSNQLEAEYRTTSAILAADQCVVRPRAHELTHT